MICTYYQSLNCWNDLQWSLDPLHAIHLELTISFEPNNRHLLIIARSLEWFLTIIGSYTPIRSELIINSGPNDWYFWSFDHWNDIKCSLDHPPSVHWELIVCFELNSNWTYSSHTFGACILLWTHQQVLQSIFLILHKQFSLCLTLCS